MKKKGDRTMQIKSITDEAFKKYGRVLKIEVPDLLERLAKTPVTDGVEYVASAPELEACSEREAIQNSIYGGMPIQIGYCNGTNHTLNAVEYHRDSEIDIALDGAILLIGSEADVEDDFTYDTAKMEAFAAPAGAVVELYATTLHYAPVTAGKNCVMQIVAQSKGTNTPLLSLAEGNEPENKYLLERNKWVLCHPEAKEALGPKAFVGIKGDNITVIPTEY